MSTGLPSHSHPAHATTIAKNAALIHLSVAPTVKNLEAVRRAIVEALAGNAGCFDVEVRTGSHAGTFVISIVGSEQCVCSACEAESSATVAERLEHALTEAHLGASAA